MARYTVHFEWPHDVRVEDEISIDLNTRTPDVARIQAAMLYAIEEFELGPPPGYRIIEDRETEIYRYPEPTLH